MRLQYRFILLLGFLLFAVGLTVWYGVRPGYEAAILSERVTIASEQQRERIDIMERQLEKWIVALVEMQKNLISSGDINQTRLLFSGYTALLPELIGVRLIEQDTGEFLELRAVGSSVLPEESNVPLQPIGGSAAQRLTESAAQNLYLGWAVNQGYILLTTVFNLGPDSFRLTAIFQSADLERILLDDTFGDGSLSVLWFSGRDDGLSRNEILPDVRVAFEPVTRFREMTVDNRETIVLSSPVTSLYATHAIYMDPALIQGPIRKLFYNSLIVLVLAFIALSMGSILLFAQLSKPISDFITDIKPLESYDFSNPIRESTIPELRELTGKLEEIRSQLAYYKRINVEKIIINQESLSLMMEYASDPIAVFDATGAFTLRNNRFVDLFLHADLPAPGTILDFDDSEILTIVKTQDPEEYRVSELTIKNEGCEVVVKTGGERAAYTYDQQRISVYNEEGGLVGGQLLLFDLTRERELDQLRNDMINIIIHELKNPIAGIRGLTNALIDDPEFGEDELNEIYTLIDSSAESLQQLVERFLQVSRLESNLGNIERDLVYIPELVKSITSEMAILLNPKSLKYNISIDESIEPIMVSNQLFEDVVRNLLSNAIKYGGNNRSIDVTLKLEMSHFDKIDLIFSVTDYGYGIPEEHREGIFKKFYRIKAYDIEKGTGLGLPHVREIVRLHDGTITVESNPDIGSRFIVRIPYKPILNKEPSH